MTEAPIAAPCKVRQAMSMGIDAASTQATEAAVYVPRPISRMGRRPKRSESGPHTSCEVPKASSSNVSVSCACETGAPKPSVSEGRAGR
jgi:hypothetical protein